MHLVYRYKHCGMRFIHILQLYKKKSQKTEIGTILSTDQT